MNRRTLDDWNRAYPKLGFLAIKRVKKVVYLKRRCSKCKKERWATAAISRFIAGSLCLDCNSASLGSRKKLDWKSKYANCLDFRYENKRAKLLMKCPVQLSPSCKKQKWFRPETVAGSPKLPGTCPNCAVFKGGYVNKLGYRVLFVNGKAKMGHRYVMEQHLGRDLTKEETVHHRNGKRLDNRVSNLQVRLAGNHPRGISPQDAISWLKSLGYSVKKS